MVEQKRLQRIESTTIVRRGLVNSRGQELVVGYTRFRNDYYLVVRRYFKEKETGNLRPSRYGLHLRMADADWLITALRQAHKAVPDED